MTLTKKIKFLLALFCVCIISFGAEAQTYLRTVVSQTDTAAMVAAVVNLGDGRLMYRFTRDNSLLEGDYRILGRYHWRYELAQFSGGMYDGKYQSFEDDKLTGEGIYKAGLLNGMFINYHSDGSIRREAPFVDGELHGIEKIYYDNGKLESVQGYKNGKLHGIGQSWSLTDGEYIQRTETNHIDGVPDGKQIDFAFFSSDGIITVYYDKGVRVGEFTQRRLDGSLIMQGQYVNGEKDGVWTEYRANGNPQKISTYKNDKLNGELKTFSSDGTLLSHEHYVNEELEGIRKDYFSESGTLRMEYHYVGGRRDGEYKLYRDDGMLREEGRMERGREVFKKEYHPNGNVRSISNYLQNRDRHGENNTYFLDGTPEKIANYVNGRREGVEKEYFASTGKLRTEYNFVNGNRVGEYKIYFDDGTLREEGRYENGDMVYQKEYHSNGNVRRIRERNSRGAWETLATYRADGSEI